MKNWTLRQRIYISFSLVIAIMVLMAVLIYSDLLSIEDRVGDIRSDALPGMHLGDQLRTADAERMVLTQQLSLSLSPEQRQAVLLQLRGLEERSRALEVDYLKTLQRPEDREAFALLQVQRREYEEVQRAIVDYYAQGGQGAEPTLLLERLVPMWLEGRALRARMMELDRQAAEEYAQGVLAEVQQAEASMLVMLLVALLVAVASGYLLMRAILAPMQRILDVLDTLREGKLNTRLALERQDEYGVIQSGLNGMTESLVKLVSQSQQSSIAVTTAVTEIAATARQQEATATETAATTTEIGATSREILATSRDLLRTMGEITASAEQASVLAGSGQEGLIRMEETMHQVIGAAELVNAKLAILSEKAGTINQVVTTIVKVADQTNLLSLNAAIEAEKAGEYGRGFSVVATEVRRLADQTAVATYDIEQMVREIQSAVSAGVMGMDKFSEEVRRGMAEVQDVGEQLGQIIQRSQALSPRLSMVNEGMQTQATGAEQISQALLQLGEATGQTVESLRQISSAIDELSQVASGLRSGVSRFQV